MGENDYLILTRNKKKKKKRRRKAQWSQTLQDDLVDIIISSEGFKRKLIFTNTKNQQNGEIYKQILAELRHRPLEREEQVPFNFVQVCTEFKKNYL